MGGGESEWNSSGSNLVSEKVLNFLNWMQKLQHATADVEKGEA